MNENMTNAEIRTAQDDSTAAVLTTIRSAVRGIGVYSAYVEAHGVTRETVKDHAANLAHLAFPKAERVQKKDGKRTIYGNAVQAAGAGLRNALPPVEGKKSTALLTSDGKAASLEEVIDAWNAAQA